MKRHTYEFREHLNFTDILIGKCVVAVGIGPERDAILLAVDPDNEEVPFGFDDQPGWASFPDSKVDHSYPATVIHLRDYHINCIELTGVDAAYPIIQPIVDGQTLIVSARCQYRHGNPEQNAVIYDRDGKVMRRLVFGDGIESIQVSHNQQIWVSYFDECIFGNNEWPPQSLGSDGLLCFDTKGQISWRFHAPGGFDFIADCYALNVANDAVWICYYTDFPIVKIKNDGEVQGWENKFVGIRAIAINHQHVLLWGGYGDEGNRCVVQTFAGEKLVSPEKLELHLPTGEALRRGQVIGRDSILHAFEGTIWYQFDLRDLPIT